MAGKDDYEILCVRNYISLCIDDLAALAINSTLAFDLRQFSAEVMNLHPGFAFSLKQAKALKKATETTLGQYRKHIINDGDVMNYIANARTILMGNQMEMGGSQMGFLHRITHRKEIEKQQSRQELDRQYAEVLRQIEECEAMKNSSIKAASGYDRNSAIYRQSEREYKKAKDKLILLNKQESKLRESLEAIDRVHDLETFRKQQDTIIRATETALGSDEDVVRTVARVDQGSSKHSQKMSNMRDYTDSMFVENEDEAFRPDDDFSAAVAGEDRRKAAKESAGAAFSDQHGQSSDSASEFFSLVNADIKNE